MVRIILFLIISLSVLTISCNDCLNCEPFTQEPYLRVKFLNSNDSTIKVISIDSVNQMDAKLFRHFSDTTYEFRFPLDMHQDTANFDIVYHKLANEVNYQRNSISIYYERNYIKRNDNYILVECDITESYVDSDQYILVCKDSSNVECLSNESFLKIYN